MARADEYHDDFDTERYQGSLSEDRKRHGHGVYYYPNGDYYYGHWRKGRKEGRGTFVFANGEEQKGWFYKDDYTGSTPHEKLRKKRITTNMSYDQVFEDPGPYYGSYNDNKRHGQGVCYYRNGDYYKGNWRKNRKEGQGTHVFADGRRHVGWFYRNEYVGRNPNMKLRIKMTFLRISYNEPSHREGDNVDAPGRVQQFRESFRNRDRQQRRRNNSFKLNIKFAPALTL